MVKDVDWVELAAYARAQGIPARTVRRRLVNLHAQRGNVLQARNAPGTSVRKWWFDASALRAPVPMAAESARPLIAEQHERLDRIEARLTKLRDDDARLKRRVAKR